MVQKFVKLFSVIILISLLITSIGYAEGVPKPKGDIYIQDFAGVLSQQEKYELVQIGKKLEDATKAQIGVLTIDTIGDTSIEEFSTNALREYGLGDKELDNGVLLVIALNDRKVRIEVGYGLEGALPDGKIGRILDEFTVPFLKEGQPNMAVISTYKVLYNEVLREYNIDPNQMLNIQPAPSSQQTKTDGKLSLKEILFGIVILGLIILDFIFTGGRNTMAILYIVMSLSRGGRGGGGPRGGGGGSSGGGGASRGW